jgi:hypothetical protein
MFLKRRARAKLTQIVRQSMYIPSSVRIRSPMTTDKDQVTYVILQGPPGEFAHLIDPHFTQLSIRTISIHLVMGFE